MRFLMTLMAAITLTACQAEFVSQNPFTWHKQPAEFFDPVINAGKMPTTVDLATTKTVANPSYPIELALFEDGQFYYMLETLGDGTGTWSYDQGQLKLYAERTLFAMKIGLHAISEHDPLFALDFIDRFGTQYLDTEINDPITSAAP